MESVQLLKSTVCEKLTLKEMMRKRVQIGPDNLIIEFMYPKCACCGSYIRLAKTFYLSNYEIDDGVEGTVKSFEKCFSNIKEGQAVIEFNGRARQVHYRYAGSMNYITKTIKTFLNFIFDKLKKNLACSLECLSELKKKEFIYEKDLILESSLFWKKMMDYKKYKFFDDERLTRRQYVNSNIYYSILSAEYGQDIIEYKDHRIYLNDVQKYLTKIKPEDDIYYEEEFDELFQKNMPYGKYKGNSFWHICEIYRGWNYIFWLIENESEEKLKKFKDFYRFIEIIRKVKTFKKNVVIKAIEIEKTIEDACCVMNDRFAHSSDKPIIKKTSKFQYVPDKPIEEEKIEIKVDHLSARSDPEKEFDKMIENKYKGIKMPIGQFKGKLLTELYNESKSDDVIKSRFKWMIDKFDLSGADKYLNNDLRLFLIDIKNKH